MSNDPTYAIPNAPMARARTSGICIASLVLGILLCIPGITGILAVILGIAGIRSTRDPAVRGRGMAIAGLVLGLVGLLMWTGMGTAVAFVIKGSAAPRAALHDFASNVCTGKLTEALAEADASTITADQLDAVHTAVAAWGTYGDFTSFSINISVVDGHETCALSGIAKFSSGPHPFDAVLIKDASGDWKVAGFHFR